MLIAEHRHSVSLVLHQRIADVLMPLPLTSRTIRQPWLQSSFMP
jgi:hypothetical protein